MSETRGAAPVIILDRDGTIVVDRNYLGDPVQLEFLPGAVAGLRKLHELGCRLVVITNQSGIGRGLLTLEQVQRVNDGLSMMMNAIGAPLVATYYCPHAPDAGCDCRKPAVGLLLQAANELSFDPAQVIVIGDKASDIQLGQRVGAFTVLVKGDHSATAAASKPDATANDLYDAAQLIEARLSRLSASINLQ